MPLDQYVTLGRSGLRVSRWCLGTMTFGEDLGWGASVEESQRIIDAYVDAGGNFLDTANIYTKGHSEQIIGDHIGRQPARRDRVVIATKFLGNMHLGDPNGGGSHRKNMFNSVEESLRRLQTDYIDLYWVHFYDRHTPVEETMRALDDLVRAGKVRYVGFSDHPAWVCARAQTLAELKNWTPLIGLQIEYSLAERTVEFDLIPMAQQLGMGVTPWSPLKGGLLTDKYASNGPRDTKRGEWVSKHLDSPRVQAILSTLERVAREADCSMAEAALAWCAARPGVSSVIFGARTVDQLQTNLAAAGRTLSDEHQHALTEASQPENVPFPHNFLGSAPTLIQGGTTVNGTPSQRWPLAPQTDEERW